MRERETQTEREREREREREATYYVLRTLARFVCVGGRERWRGGAPRRQVEERRLVVLEVVGRPEDVQQLRETRGWWVLRRYVLERM